MNRQRKIDEELWEESDEKLSSDHVVERFFSQHEHDTDDEVPRRSRPGGRSRRKAPAGSEADE